MKPAARRGTSLSRNSRTEELFPPANAAIFNTEEIHFRDKWSLTLFGSRADATLPLAPVLLDTTKRSRLPTDNTEQNYI